MPIILFQKLYRFIFWTGYIAVLSSAFMPVAGELNKKFFGPESFHIRLDHLLHFAVYFLICMYFLVGQRNKITLFNSRSILKFILFLLILGTVTELVQLWVPKRAFNPMDWISNVTGICIGMAIIIMAQRHYGMKE